jgi:hypothetical protein
MEIIVVERFRPYLSIYLEQYKYQANTPQRSTKYRQSKKGDPQRADCILELFPLASQRQIAQPAAVQSLENVTRLH